MEEDQQKTKQDEGNVWTSNSDLFMAIAVVFLVMFIFSLLMSGINTLKTSKEKEEQDEYLLGKLPKKVLKQEEQRASKIKNSMKKLLEKQKIIEENVSKLAHLKNMVIDHKKLLNEMLKEQKTKSSRLLAANINVKKRDKKISQLNKTIKEKKTQITELINQEKKLLEQIRKDKRNYLKLRTKDNKEFLFKLEKKKNELTQSQNQISNLERKLNNKNDAIKEMDKKLNFLSKNINSLQKELKHNKGVVYGKNSEIDSLRKTLNNLHKSKSKLEDTILKQHLQKSELKQKIDKLKVDMQNQKDQEELKLFKSLRHAEKNQQINQELQSLRFKQTELQEQLSLKDMAYKNLQKEYYKYQEEQAKRALASEKKVVYELAPKKKTIRKNIAKIIAQRMRQSGLDVDVDPSTGTITILGDDSFIFKYDSFRLSRSMKNKLSKLVPIYAETLFGDAKISKYIQGIHIVGHASPEYKKRYVSPKTKKITPYRYNIDLSLKRAQQIAYYIFGRRIGRYKYKNKLQEFSEISGRGYMQPVISKNKKSKCGPYDCFKSRRVEIQFTLKNTINVEDANIIEKRTYNN